MPLAEPLPIHLVYRAAWVQDDGVVHFRPDMYGYDDLSKTRLVVSRAVGHAHAPRTTGALASPDQPWRLAQ